MERPFGVNLIGHAFETFGIGNDIRMAARALQQLMFHFPLYIILPRMVLPV